MAGDPMGLTGLMGAATVPKTLEDILKQQMLRQEMQMALAKEAQAQKEAEQANLARQQQLGLQGRQVDIQGQGQRLNEQKFGLDQREYEEGAPRRQADLENVQGQNKTAADARAELDRLAQDPTLGKTVAFRRAGIPMTPTDPNDVTGATDYERRLGLVKAQGDQSARVAGMRQQADPGLPLAGTTGQPGATANAAALEKYAPGVRGQIKALAEGRQPFPSGMALRTPYWQQMIQAVQEYDPSFDAINYNARAKTRQDFTSGRSAQQVNAINTVIGHLAQLSKNVDKLGNVGFTPANEVKNYLSKKTGQNPVTNFESNRESVVDELVRVWRQTGGAEADIARRIEQLNAANSPEQLHGTIAQLGELLESKLEASQSQLQQGMGIADIQVLTPQSRAALDALHQKVRPSAAGADGQSSTGSRFDVLKVE